MTRISLYSYSMYLVNVSLAKIVTRILPISANPARIAVMATVWIVAVYALSGLCYRYFESRMTSLRDADSQVVSGASPGRVTARCVTHGRLKARSERASGGPTPPARPEEWHRSLEVAELGQPLLDDFLLFERVLKRVAVGTAEGLRGRVVAGRSGRAGVGRRAGRGRRWACPRRGPGWGVRAARGSWAWRR